MQFLGGVNIGLRHVYPAVEDVGFSEDDVFLANLVILFGILASRKPREVHDALAVSEVGHHALLPWAGLECLEAHDVALDLDIGHLGGHFPDAVYLAAVDIFVGEVLQKVIKGSDAEFVFQHLVPLRAYAREVFYFGIEDGGQL